MNLEEQLEAAEALVQAVEQQYGFKGGMVAARIEGGYFLGENHIGYCFGRLNGQKYGNNTQH